MYINNIFEDFVGIESCDYGHLLLFNFCIWKKSGKYDPSEFGKLTKNTETSRSNNEPNLYEVMKISFANQIKLLYFTLVL